MYYSGLVLFFPTHRTRLFTCKFFKGFQACLKKTNAINYNIFDIIETGETGQITECKSFMRQSMKTVQNVYFYN